ncbi:MAG: peptide-methionine (S)-S-oxide reductase MsrA [Thermoanaerobaculia bacterium]
MTEPIAFRWITAALFAVLVTSLGVFAMSDPKPAGPRPATLPTTPVTVPAGLEVATLAGGCFWCIEAVFDELKGVESAVSGYAGGYVEKPTYKQVCTGTTGHAEAVEIRFDPKVLSFHDLLDVFFTVHDPTTLDRQGADIGTQYRSAIYFHSPEQERIARDYIRDATAAKKFADPIVTEVTAFSNFYPAEDYHQEYFKENASQPYCSLVIAPKIAKFHKLFKDRLKSE